MVSNIQDIQKYLKVDYEQRRREGRPLFRSPVYKQGTLKLNMDSVWCCL